MAITDQQTAETLAKRQRRRLADAFASIERRGRLLALRVRTGALLVIAAWLVANAGGFPILYYLVIVGVALVAGLARWSMFGRRLDGPWADYALVLFDAAIMAWAFMVPNPMDPFDLPVAVQLRFGSFVYFFVFMAGLALTHSSRLVLAYAFAAAVAWCLGLAWALQQPGAFAASRAAMIEGGRDVWLATYLDPYFIDLTGEAVRLIALLLAGWILAVTAWQSRRLALTQVAAERQRARLAQYFSPNMIDELGGSAEDSGRVRSQDVAVLFVDIVGFTAFAERADPERVIALIREFGAKVAACVFDHGGTLDKFLGDGAMATFGTPRSGPRDATNALECARGLILAIERINDGRRRRGEPDVRVGIGVHYGPVILGDVGDERRLEFAVLGDTVNVASRLERLTRRLDASILASADAVAAARREDPTNHALIAAFEPAETVSVRGRTQRVEVLRFKGDAR